MIKVIKFYATWCQSCKMLEPIFKNLKSKFNDVEFEEIDIDQNNGKEMLAKFGGDTLPIIVVLKNNQAVETIRGVKPLITLEKKIKAIKGEEKETK